MKQIIIFLVLQICTCEIVKRQLQSNSTEDSFQVKVSAGYHFDNVTTVFPVYNKAQEVNDTKTYQVHENIENNEEKKFPAAQMKKLRSVEKLLTLKKPTNVTKEPTMHLQPAIIEVLRLPAMYELRLQPDPQRMAAINSAFLRRIMHQSPKKQQAQASTLSLNYARPQRHSFHFNVKHNNNEYKPQKRVKSNLPAPTSYQNVYLQNVQKELPVQKAISHEIVDFYQKPQAIHEVPAPILNKDYEPAKVHEQGYNYEQPKVQLVYGKTQHYHQGQVESVPNYQQENLEHYTNLNQNIVQSYQAQSLLEGNKNQNVFDGYKHHNLDNYNDLVNYKYLQNNQNLDSYNQNVENYNQENLEGYNQNLESYNQNLESYKTANIFNSPHYHGFNNPQNHFNHIIGDNLDQDLANHEPHNPYLNNGILTITDFQQPNQNAQYQQQYHLPQPNQNAQYHLPDVHEPQQEPSAVQNTEKRDENPISRKSYEYSNFYSYKPRKNFQKKYISKRMYKPRPMDYILYIKERTLD